MTRRDLLTRLSAGTLAALTDSIALPAAGRVDARQPVRPGLPMPAADGARARATKLSAFPLEDVRLLPGPFLDAQQRDLAYLLALEPDRMLHNFRVNAKLAPKAPVYPGWESEEPWVGIRCHGHTLGHYLTAASLMYASTGDTRLKQRVDDIVADLAECQQATGTGLVCAFPDSALQLENAVMGRRFVGVPWYTMHKIFAGLRDANIHAASAAALVVLTELADWAVTATSPMTDDAFEVMLRTEHGGMNEVLADVSALTNDPKYLALARRFSHKVLLTPLAESRDTLDGLHANTQIPKAIGFQRIAELTGDDRYGRAAVFFWHTVAENRSFVTGGHGDNEHFFPPAEFAKHLQSAKTMETCCTHNMLRLTRMLFQAAPAAAYADYYERALYNGILASQDPDTGMGTYFQATRPGYVRLFHTPDRSFWCCTGTGIENHAKYGDSIYFHTEDAIWVNLFMLSTVSWKAKGLALRQTTAFPSTARTKLTVTAASPIRATVNIRRPVWSPDTAVRVNGRAWTNTSAANGYVALDRVWRTGDVIDVTVHMRLRTEALPGASDIVAFVYGPIVLAGRLGAEGLTPGSQLIVNERESGSMLNAAIDVPTLSGEPEALLNHMTQDARDPLLFRTRGLGRPRDVELAPFYRLAHERYNLYWKVVPA
jgi:uncharacterized protein